MKMHGILEIKAVVQREMLKKLLSLDATLYRETFVHFDGYTTARVMRFGVCIRYLPAVSFQVLFPLKGSVAFELPL